ASEIGPQVADAMLDAGWIINAPRPTVLRLAPPLIVTAEVIDEFAVALVRTLDAVSGNG
ncbi:MAG: acetylornithine transaminase, partial [Brooklawnia sp.]|nr:acetylornithine transaminase [Brooklawnia sp.]